MRRTDMLFVAFGTQDPEQREGAVAAQWSTDRGSRASEVKDEDSDLFKATCFSLTKRLPRTESQLFLIEHPPRASSRIVIL